MEKNLIGRLKVMKELGIKPNFSALQREFKVDRHTIKKYYDNDGVPIRKSVHRKSLWDPYEEEINDLMNKLGVTKKSVFYYMKNKYGDAFPGTYDGFKAYTLRKDIKCREESVAHVLYETDPGEQLQFDWKENIKIHLKNKKEITFNVFSATLGYSREHVFIYSLTKTTEDLIRCLIETYRRLGGVTETAITDNMSAIIAGKNRKINPKVNQLMKDLGVNLKLCKPKVPQTKGKVEDSNKFVKWIMPYDYELETEEDIINVIENIIPKQCNSQINTATKMPPATLFLKEKEYLKPLNNRVLLDSYIQEHTTCAVPPTLLITYKGNRYSVPQRYIHKRVDIYPIDDRLYIYHKKSLIAIHNISQNSVNYKEEHYKDALATKIKNKDIDIDSMSKKNLEKLSKLGNL